MQPYKDSSNIRNFSKDVKKLELVWHKDDEDRNIEIFLLMILKNQMLNTLKVNQTKRNNKWL